MNSLNKTLKFLKLRNVEFNMKSENEIIILSDLKLSNKSDLVLSHIVSIQGCLRIISSKNIVFKDLKDIKYVNVKKSDNIDFSNLETCSKNVELSDSSTIDLSKLHTIMSNLYLNKVSSIALNNLNLVDGYVKLDKSTKICLDNLNKIKYQLFVCDVDYIELPILNYVGKRIIFKRSTVILTKLNEGKTFVIDYNGVLHELVSFSEQPSYNTYVFHPVSHSNKFKYRYEYNSVHYNKNLYNDFLSHIY